MRILITGGAGFAGANVAVYLATRGHNVTVLDNLARRGSEHSLSRLGAAGVDFRHGDVRCPEDWSGLKADFVINAASQPSAIDGYGNPSFDFEVNTVGVLRALEFCRRQDAGIIQFSTNKCYPVSAVNNRPIIKLADRYECREPVDESCSLDGGDRSIYGASKIMADLMIQEWADAFQMPAIVNRFSCLAGPWQWGKCAQGWVAWWVIAHRLGLPLKYIGFEGRQVRDVLFVDDLCRLLEMELDTARPGGPGEQVFNVGGGQENALSLRQCTVLVRQQTGCKVPIVTEEQPRRADFHWYVSDTSKVRQQLGWWPMIHLEEGLEQIDAWVVDNLGLLKAMYGQNIAAPLIAVESPELVEV